MDTAEGDNDRDKVETKSWGLRWISPATAVAVLIAFGLVKALRKKYFLQDAHNRALER